MKIEALFTAYKKLLSETPDIEKIFADSGITKGTKVLDFGFFPYGSGVLDSEKSRLEEAEIESCKIMVLGNDFGTENYLLDKCPGDREKDSNPTIKNLISLNGLGLDVKTTFFTNLHVGLRSVEKDVSEKEKATNIKRAKKIQKEYTNTQTSALSFLKLS